MTVEDLGDGVYGFFTVAARSLVIVTDAGVIYIDPLSREDAERGLIALRKITSQPVKIVIYSHQHWDHVLGAKVFKDQGAEIVSHAACVKWFERHPHPDLVMPDRTVAGGEVIALGGKRIQLRYFGANHGDCLLVPWLLDRNMPFLVDLATPGTLPIGAMPDYDPGEWVRTLKELEAIPFDTFISAHGPATAPKSVLTERRQFLEDVMAIVARELKAGTPVKAIAAKIDLPQYAHLRGYPTELPTLVDRLSYYYGMGW